MATYTNLKTGEQSPAHLLGTTEDGRNLYSAQEGWEPDFNYACDEDGNWIEYPALSDYRQIWSATAEWLEISEREGFEVDYDADPLGLGDLELALASVGENPTDPEAGSATIIEPRECDTLLRAGDVLVTTGPGGDVYFFRKIR